MVMEHRTLAEILEAGQKYNHPLSEEGKLAHYDRPCSAAGAYVVDQLQISVLLGLTMHALTKGSREQEAKSYIAHSMKSVMEYIGNLEQEVANLREALALKEAL